MAVPTHTSQQVPSQPPQKKKKWPWIVGGSAAALVVFAAIGSAGGGTPPPAPASPAVSPPSLSVASPAPVKRLQIPDLAGQNGKIAIDQLKRLGFTNISPSSLDAGDPVVVLPENWTVTSTLQPAGMSYSSDAPVIVLMTKNTGGSSQPAQSAGPRTSFGSGTFVVGEDIEAGTYKTTGPTSLGMCYWARLNSTDGDFKSIIANGAPQGPATVTIKSSDKAFQSNGCQWTKK